MQKLYSMSTGTYFYVKYKNARTDKKVKTKCMKFKTLKTLNIKIQKILKKSTFFLTPWDHK